MMRRIALFSLLLLLTATLSHAQFGFGQQGGIPAADEIVTLSVGEVSHAGGEVRGVVRASILETWHVNSETPLESYSIPTKLSLQPESLELTSAVFPPHFEKEFEFAGEALAVYKGTVEIPFTARVSGELPAQVTALLRYQACNDTICLPPVTVSASAAIPGGTAGPGTASPGATSGFTPLPADGGGSLLSTDIGAMFASRGLLLTLALIFLLGLALNLTPCVYPLIPITLAFFGSQGAGSRPRRVGLASVYVLGLATTYSILGVFAALSGRLFGAWLQMPSVLVFFAVLMLALSASMFGVYEIRVPQFISNRASGKAGTAGALSMGLLAGIVAAPCVGPFIISLITLVGQRGSASFGFLLFFVLALGLGLPYLLLGIFSSGISSIPRSGPWLVRIKQALGFVLIAMAFYFLRPLTGDTVYTWGVGLSLLAGAIFLVAQRRGTKGADAIRWGAAALLLAASIWFVIPRGGEGIEWAPYDEASIAAAAAGGKPVIIDFYADWCLPCKELDQKTFSDPVVVAESERFVRLKADLTHTADEKTKALSERYGIIGVPTIVFLESSGSESDRRLSGFEPAGKFLERMQAVR
jgi:thioredoxin:protein disulfide reductase